MSPLTRIPRSDSRAIPDICGSCLVPVARDTNFRIVPKPFGAAAQAEVNDAIAEVNAANAANANPVALAGPRAKANVDAHPNPNPNAGAGAIAIAIASPVAVPIPIASPVANEVEVPNADPDANPVESERPVEASPAASEA